MILCGIARRSLVRFPLSASCRAIKTPIPLTRALKSRQVLRLKTTASAPTPSPKAAPTKKLAYPEKLLVYHAGTGRTVFVGCLKVTTIFVFAFFALVVAPAHFHAEDEPKWISAAVLVSGIIPFLFVTKTSGPFVNYIHLHLPPYARYSREFVHRYSMALPATAKVDITTMNLLGKPRVTRMPVSELRALPKPKLMGGANFTRERDPKKVVPRKWWMGREVREFAVRGGEGHVREKGVWEHVVKGIKKSGTRA